jgi:hypothetical protein
VSEVGAYPSEAPFVCSTPEEGPGLAHKHRNRPERLASDKHSGLLRILVNYGRETFYNSGPKVDLANMLKY